MAIPSSAATVSPIIFMSTAADALEYTLPVSTIRWHMTTAATSTWTLAVTQSTVAQPSGTTVGWPLIGTTTQSLFISGSTAIVNTQMNGIIDFPINNWLYGIVLVTISGGFIEVIKPPPACDWAIKKPAGALA